MTTVQPMTESEKMKLIRSALGLSQRELAAALQTSQARISAIERGLQPASRRFIDLLQSKYRLNADWFINTRGEMFGKPVTMADIAGDDKDEIIRLLKEQNLILSELLKDKEKLIQLLEQRSKTAC